MRARIATARCKDQITADISCARVQQHHDCGLLLNRTGSMQAAAGCVECTAGTRVPGLDCHEFSSAPASRASPPPETHAGTPREREIERDFERERELIATHTQYLATGVGVGVCMYLCVCVCVCVRACVCVYMYRRKATHTLYVCIYVCIRIGTRQGVCVYFVCACVCDCCHVCRTSHVA